MLLNYLYKMNALPQQSAQNPYGANPYGLTPEQMKQFGAAYPATHGQSMDQLLALYQHQAQQQYTYAQMQMLQQQMQQNYGNTTAASRKQMQAYEQMLGGMPGYAATLKWQQQQTQQHQQQQQQQQQQVCQMRHTSAICLDFLIKYRVGIKKIIPLSSNRPSSISEYSVENDPQINFFSAHCSQ